MFRRFFFTGQISSLSSNKLGRESVIVVANGSAKDIKYAMSMNFGKMSEPLTKVQTVDSTSVAQSYNLAYKYESAEHPTAPTQIGHEHYTYDANGNPILVENDSTDATREMFWDEDNRLMVLSDNGKTSRYTYNAGGERIIKSHGSMEGVYINGAPQGITFHETDEFTLYPASILSVSKHRFTKHYFIGDKRVASRIGLGEFNNVYGTNGSNVTAGQRDYAERMNQIENQREDYYKAAGVAPGLPTMKGSYADPEVTGVGYNVLIKELGDHRVPENWVQHPVINTDEGSNPGASLSWGSPENPDDVVAGYGYVAADTSDVEETFYYHSDHLGSTSYITDQKANVTQYDAYLPYGELLVDEHSSSAEMPYKFNGKELDEETGLYYYGARYMNPITSMWYGVDPLAEKYPNVSAFVYCMGNPVKLFDPDGKKILFVNGHWTPGLPGEWLGSRYPGRKYWSNGFAQAAQQYFDDYSQITDNNYIDGSSTCGFDMSGQDRYEKGYEYAKANINELTKNMSKDEPFYMVTHSEGAAYGAGIAQYLLDNGYNVKKVLHLSADEGDEFTTPAKPLTIQLAYDGDWVTGNKRIGNTDKFGLLDSEHLGWRFKHGTTKGSSIFKYAKELEKAVLLHWQGEVDGKFSDWYSVKQGTSNAKFVNINGYRIKQQNEK